MKNLRYYLLFVLGLGNLLFGQLVPYEEPLLIQNTYNKQIPTHSILSDNINQKLNIDIIENGKLYQNNNNTHIFYSINLYEDNIYNLSFDYKNVPFGTKLFIIENNKFLGPIYPFGL